MTDEGVSYMDSVLDEQCTTASETEEQTADKSQRLSYQRCDNMNPTNVRWPISVAAEAVLSWPYQASVVTACTSKSI